MPLSMKGRLRSSDCHAFTLIEIMLVLIIMVILATISSRMLFGSLPKAKIGPPISRSELLSRAPWRNIIWIRETIPPRRKD